MNKINKTTFFKKFNNIVSSQYDYDVLYNYLEFGQYPTHISELDQKAIYDERYKYFKIGKSRLKKITFEFKDLNLEVIPFSRVEETIDLEYKKDTGLGKGIKLFY